MEAMIMKMEIEIDSTAKALDKGHRPWLHPADRNQL
jgi:hypothetical protein